MPRKTYEVILDVGGDTLPIRASSYESLVRHFLRTLFCEALVRSRRPKLDRATPDLWGGYTAALETFNTICQEQGIRFDSGNEVLCEAVKSLPLQRLTNMCKYALEWAEDEVKYERAWRWGSTHARKLLPNSSNYINLLPEVAATDLKAEHLPQDVQFLLAIQNKESTSTTAISLDHPEPALAAWSLLQARLPKSPQEVATWSRYHTSQSDHKRTERLWLWRKDGEVLVDADVYLYLAQVLEPSFPMARLYRNRVQAWGATLSQIVAAYAGALPPQTSPGEVYFEFGDGQNLGKMTWAEVSPGQLSPVRLTLVYGPTAEVFSTQYTDGRWDLCWKERHLTNLPLPIRSLPQTNPPTGWSDDTLVSVRALTFPCKAYGSHYVDMQPVSEAKYNDLYRQWVAGVGRVLEWSDPKHPARAVQSRSWEVTAALLGLQPPAFMLRTEHTNYPILRDPNCETLRKDPTPSPGLPYLLQIAPLGSSAVQSLYFKTQEGLCAKLQEYVTFDPKVPLEVSAAHQGVVFWTWRVENEEAQQIYVSEALRSSSELRWAARLTQELHKLWYRCPGSKMFLRTKTWALALSNSHFRFTKEGYTGVLRDDGVWEHSSPGAADELFQELLNEVTSRGGADITNWGSSGEDLMLGAQDRSLEAQLLELLREDIYTTPKGLLRLSRGTDCSVLFYDKQTRDTQSFRILGDTLLCDEESRRWLEERVRGAAHSMDIPGTFKQRCNLLEVQCRGVPSHIRPEGAHTRLASGHDLIAIADGQGTPWLHVKLPTGEVKSTALSGVRIDHEVVSLAAELSKTEIIAYRGLRQRFDLEQARAATAVSDYVSNLMTVLEAEIRKAGSGYLLVRGRDGLLYALDLRAEEGVWYDSIRIGHGSDILTLLRDTQSGAWRRTGMDLPAPLEDILLQAFQKQQANPGKWLHRQLHEALDAIPTTTENREQGKQGEMVEVGDRTSLTHVEAAAAASAQDLSPTAEPPPAGNEQTTPSGEGTKDENMPTDKDKANDKTLAEKAKAAAAAAATEAKENATEAAWRTAATQLVKLTRDPLAAVIQRHLGPEDESIRKKIADFLTTEAGTAMLAGVLALGLSTLPQNERTAQLARQLRIKAMADMGDLAADVLMGPLRQVVSSYLQGDAPEAPAAPPMLGPATPLETQLHGETTMASASLLD